MNEVAAGSLSGVVATAPMTALMLAMHRALPEHERYALPPEQIAEVTARKAGAHEAANDPDTRGALALVLHFGFGASAGAIYPSIEQALPGPPALKGTAFAMAVWAASYLRLFPAARILPPATEHPARRNALMIAAHVVWGSVLGVLFARLNRRH